MISLQLKIQTIVNYVVFLFKSLLHSQLLIRENRVIFKLFGPSAYILLVVHKIAYSFKQCVLTLCMLGTIVNVLAIILGSIIGLLIKSKIPERINKIIFQVIGLFTITLGITMAIKTNNFLIVVFSLIIGSIIGELFDIEKYLETLSLTLKNKLKSSNDKFSEGFITATLIYCIGPMAILGSIEEGLGNDPNLLFAKSVLDGVASIALSSALGIGVIFSTLPLLIYQGGITLFAGYVSKYLNDALIIELSAVGGILLLGLGMNIAEIKRFKVVNMLPSLLVVVILSYFFL